MFLCLCFPIQDCANSEKNITSFLNDPEKEKVLLDEDQENKLIQLFQSVSAMVNDISEVISVSQTQTVEEKHNSRMIHTITPRYRLYLLINIKLMN